MKKCTTCAAFTCSSTRNTRCNDCNDENINWTEQLTEEEEYDIECNNVSSENVNELL